MKGFSEKIQKEVKKQKGGFLGMLLGSLGTILLGNLLTSKNIIRAGESTTRAGEASIRVVRDFNATSFVN